MKSLGSAIGDGVPWQSLQEDLQEDLCRWSVALVESLFDLPGAGLKRFECLEGLNYQAMEILPQKLLT